MSEYFKDSIKGVVGAKFGLITSNNIDWNPKHGDVVQEADTGILYQAYSLSGSLAYFPLDTCLDNPLLDIKLPGLKEMITSALNYIQMAEMAEA